MKQRSPEWYEARRGKLTASRIHRLMTGGMAGINSLLDAMEREITEGEGGWLEGGGFTNEAMQWGIDHEDGAVALYEMLNDVEVEEVGIVFFDDFVGASPDGLVLDGSIEVKCPFNGKYHEETIVYGMPKKHYWQVQTQAYCTRLGWVDFISFDPRQSPDRQLFVERQIADEAAHEQIASKAAWFRKMLESGERVTDAPEGAVPKFF